MVYRTYTQPPFLFVYKDVNAISKQGLDTISPADSGTCGSALWFVALEKGPFQQGSGSAEGSVQAAPTGLFCFWSSSPCPCLNRLGGNYHSDSAWLLSVITATFQQLSMGSDEDSSHAGTAGFPVKPVWDCRAVVNSLCEGNLPQSAGSNCHLCP